MWRRRPGRLGLRTAATYAVPAPRPCRSPAGCTASLEFSTGFRRGTALPGWSSTCRRRALANPVPPWPPHAVSARRMAQIRRPARAPRTAHPVVHLGTVTVYRPGFRRGTADLVRLALRSRRAVPARALLRIQRRARVATHLITIWVVSLAGLRRHPSWFSFLVFVGARRSLVGPQPVGDARWPTRFPHGLRMPCPPARYDVSAGLHAPRPAPPTTRAVSPARLRINPPWFSFLVFVGARQIWLGPEKASPPWPARASHRRGIAVPAPTPCISMGGCTAPAGFSWFSPPACHRTPPPAGVGAPLAPLLLAGRALCTDRTGTASSPPARR